MHRPNPIFAQNIEVLPPIKGAIGAEAELKSLAIAPRQQRQLLMNDNPEMTCDQYKAMAMEKIIQTVGIRGYYQGLKKPLDRHSNFGNKPGTV